MAYGINSIFEDGSINMGSLSCHQKPGRGKNNICMLPVLINWNTSSHKGNLPDQNLHHISYSPRAFVSIFNFTFFNWGADIIDT